MAQGKKLKILFASDYPPSEVIGGSVRVLYEQCARFAQRGHAVHLLTRQARLEKGYDRIKNVYEWEYSVSFRNQYLFLKTSIINGKRLFDKICEEYSFDVLSFHQPLSAFSVLQSNKSDRLTKFYTCHSLSFEEFRTRNPKPIGVLGRILYCLNVEARKIIERKVLNASDKIVVLSQFTKNKLLGLHGVASEKIALIPGGIDLKKFYPANDKIDIRMRLDVPPEKLILFTVRNLVPRMGLENLIFAVRQAVERVPDIYLVLGGDGPLKNSLISLSQELQMQEYVKFVGFIPETGLPEYYRMADIFILPTVELEGFGLVTLEALASGVPVLGTPVGGTAEILGKLDPKYLFKDTTSESMAPLIIETCQRFKNTPRLWEEVSSQCRLFVEENYSWDKNIDSLEELFGIG